MHGKVHPIKCIYPRSGVSTLLHHGRSICHNVLRGITHTSNMKPDQWHLEWQMNKRINEGNRWRGELICSRPLNASWCSEKWGTQCGFTIKGLTQCGIKYIKYVKKSSQQQIIPTFSLEKGNIRSFFSVYVQGRLIDTVYHDVVRHFIPLSIKRIVVAAPVS